MLWPVAHARRHMVARRISPVALLVRGVLTGIDEAVYGTTQPLGGGATDVPYPLRAG